MICSKCGQELQEGAGFCTKCGTKPKATVLCAKCGSNAVETRNLTLPIISIVLSAIGIIGHLYMHKYWLYKFNVSYAMLHTSSYGDLVVQCVYPLFPLIGVLIALFAQKKQNNRINYLAGVIPCVYLIVFLGGTNVL